MAIMRRITEINGEIIMVETMIIVGNIILCTIPSSSFYYAS